MLIINKHCTIFTTSIKGTPSIKRTLGRSQRCSLTRGFTVVDENLKLSSQNSIVIIIQYLNHHSIPVCQYTSVLPENNVKGKVMSKRKIGKH